MCYYLFLLQHMFTFGLHNKSFVVKINNVLAINILMIYNKISRLSLLFL